VTDETFIAFERNNCAFIDAFALDASVAVITDDILIDAFAVRAGILRTGILIITVYINAEINASPFYAIKSSIADDRIVCAIAGGRVAGVGCAGISIVTWIPVTKINAFALHANKDAVAAHRFIYASPKIAGVVGAGI
jgi:hypothetical protein